MISKAVELALQAGFAPRVRTLRDETLVWVLLERYSRIPQYSIC